MKKIALIGLLLVMTGLAFGQLNPVQNLTWWHGYEYPYNYYSLDWQAPDIAPGDTLMGYNVYRNSVLYRFQPVIGVFCQPWNCPDGDFLLTSDFWIKVTAVYNYNKLESEVLDSIHDFGIAIGMDERSGTVRVLTNPVAKDGTLKLGIPASLQGGTVRLYNSMGVVVCTVRLARDTGFAEMSTAGLPAGLYYVTAGNGTARSGQRLIIY